MVIKFYGTRGSTPVCDPEFSEFGGNTTCVLVHWGEEDEYIFIFDAGTGIRKLGKEIMANKYLFAQKIAILFSHFHHDHIQGFPFFAPAYDPTKAIELVAYGENLKITDLKEVLSKQMESTFFPVSLENMGAKFSFELRKIKQEIFPDGQILTNSHNHPGGAHGYRIEDGEKSMVYCTDIEHGKELDKSVINFSKNADVLIHDAQYTPEELTKHKGWGHSSWEQAIQVAEQANVKKLYLTHHDPDHDDNFLQEVEYQCQKRFPNCYLAREGMEIIL